MAAQFRVNQREVQFDCESSAYEGADRLLTVLHDTGLHAAKLGCGLGQCGACAVWVGDRVQLACEVPLWSIADQSVTTLEGLAELDAPMHDVIAQAFEAEQAAQCGYCSAGIILRVAQWLRSSEIATLLAAGSLPDADAVRVLLDPHLCRCGSHERVVRAVLDCARRFAVAR
jgi:nicotinate dehydrogenase subunit A